MVTKDAIPEYSSLERLLLLLEKAPFYALYRIAIGFIFLPLLFRVVGQPISLPTLLSGFLGILLLLRLVPAVIRHALPFSKQVQDAWFKQRILAKRYDSYQWRKLFWIGLGMAGYLVSGPRSNGPQFGLAVFCLVSGALGLCFWARVQSLKPAAQPALVAP
jgi:hypothetical protein